jgi:hypothetical protein
VTLPNFQEYLLQAVVAAPLVIAAAEFLTIPIGVKGGEGLKARKRLNVLLWALFFNSFAWGLGYLDILPIVAPESVWMKIFILIGTSVVTALAASGAVDIKKNWGSKGKPKL